LSGPDSLPLADTSDMAGIHQVFREALRSAPTFVSTVEPGDSARAELVGGYYDNVLRLLHSHHEGEDELMTPKLIDRLPDHAETIQRIGNQHHAVFGAVADAEGQIAAWRDDPTEANRDSAARSLNALDEVLTPHLDEEEETIVPLAATCINVAEWGALPEHGLRTFTGDKPWLILGLVQEQMPPAKIADMQAHMPPPVLEFWTAQGSAMFDHYVADLRG
jgi:hemerythrin-like domain-containing protein